MSIVEHIRHLKVVSRFVFIRSQAIISDNKFNVLSWKKWNVPHINTRDCLEVCAIIILKPAGMLYMYQHETVTRI